jgi:hypothetical protein
MRPENLGDLAISAISAQNAEANPNATPRGEPAARQALPVASHLTEQIIGLAIQVHGDLGPGLLESVEAQTRTYLCLGNCEIATAPR